MNLMYINFKDLYYEYLDVLKFFDCYSDKAIDSLAEKYCFEPKDFVKIIDICRFIVNKETF